MSSSRSVQIPVQMGRVSGLTLDAKAVFKQNTQGWSLLVTEGNCRGREVEQRGKEKRKKQSLVSYSSRGVSF